MFYTWKYKGTRFLKYREFIYKNLKNEDVPMLEIIQLKKSWKEYKQFWKLFITKENFRSLSKEILW